MNADEDPVTCCSLRVDEITDAAICVDARWLPLSLVSNITALDAVDMVDITIPYWLAKRERLL